MVALIARYRVRHGSAQEVLALLAGFAPLAKREEGCRMFIVHRDPADEDVVLLYEQYTGEDAIAAHRETPHFKEVIEEKVLPLLEQRERNVYEVL